MMDDSRKKFIINISANFLNLPNSDEKHDKTAGEENLDKFLNLDHIITLYVTLNNTNYLEFNNTVHLENEYDRGILSFYKTKNASITDENISDVIQVNYFKGKPILGLYYTLQNIFTPMILQNKYSTEPTIQEQILQLQDSLRTSVFNNADKSENYNDSKVGLEVILNIQHEFEYWANVAKNGKRSRDRDMGHTFVDILQPLVNDFSNIDSLQYLDVEDLLESAYSILDDLWRHERYNFPQPRMEHLLTLIANVLVQYIEQQFNDIDIWQCTTNQSELFNLIENGISLISRWIDICTRLTKLFWPNHSLHAWIGDPYVPSIAIKFQERLNEILHIKTVYRQLIKLLSRAERDEIDSNEFFKPFKNIYALQCNAYIEPQWKSAVLKFEKSLRPAEERVAVKLKSQLGSVHANTRQLLHEFSRYSELITRPVVKQALLSEREQLLATLIDYVDQLVQNLQNSGDNNYNSSLGSDTPQIVQDILQLRHLETRAKEVQKVSNQILQDLTNFETLNNSVNTLLHNIKQQTSDLFDSWIRQTTKSIENKTLTLKENEPVVQFSKNKFMKVNYSPKLVVLINEVRQLSAYDYRIPTNIQEVADRAKRFMSYAKILEQVANFHNTIGDRMIPSQRPMMLAGAMGLAQLVQEEAAVTWSDEENVKTYINKLRIAVDRLSRENNQLAAYHIQLGEKVSELLQTDLIRNQHKWKDGVNFMRDTMNQVSSEGFTNMQAWKQHWDQELAKALEQQYQLGLDQIHHYLPEIKADLVLRSGRVQFNPPIEELRVKYYSQLRRYLSIPYHFRGVSDDGSKNIFSDIVERNTDKFARVYDKAEQLIDELNKLTEKWTPWLALGGVDLDELSEKYLKTWNDWDINFRESKSFGQQVAKLTSWEEHVGFFTISLGLARSDMEAHNRRYWSTLVSSLQASITRDVSIIEQFVVTATGNLTKQPRITDDIAEIHSAHAEVMVQYPQMSDLYKDLIQRNKILANWSKERVESVIRLQGPWDHLQSLLSNHQQLIEKQLEGIKSNLIGAGKALEEEIERWNIHWEEKKPKAHMENLNELLKGLKILKDQRALWDSLIQQKTKLENDCNRFGVTVPEFSKFKEVEDDLMKQEKEWAMVEDFNTELLKYCDEEWIVIRKQIYRFNDFLNQWEEILLKQTSNPLSTTLLQEIQKYKNAMSTLKLLKGEDFTELHWVDVFNRLGMDNRTIDSTTLGHFLNKVDELSDNSVITYLQNMNKKAASEIVVRQALAELESWEVQARFSLTSHLDSLGKEIMLIKDYKSIADTIGDNQCLLQSVKSSTDYESFSEKGSIWETKLSDLDFFIGFLSQIQHKWIYLEPIFSRGTLRQEQARFQRIDREFRNILESVARDPRIVALLRIHDLKSTLNTLLDQLNRCQASLINFLNDKRSKFPRFLFLSDGDLLEILGQSAHENVIQSHLKKIFAGIHSVVIKEIDQQNKKIIAMKSLHGEIVPLRNYVDIMKPVEDWLQDLVNEMHLTLKQLLSECLADGRNQHKSTQGGADPLKYPSQILCLASSINFTKRTEQAIISNNLNSFLNDLKEQSKYYANLELDNSDNENKENNESTILQLKLKALLMDLTHHIAIIEELIENNVNRLQNWHWFKQLRFYEQPNQVTLIRMANAEFEYSYEYLGNAAKIVHTPLTDKCFLTLTQGMFIGLGGNPYGPAGTGKTESVKALGGLLGRQVLVFNCDEGIDSKSMERILIGLARCGAWGCFDEFNRLDEGTLSSVSTQIQNIQTAIVNKAATLQVQDQQIEINSHCGIFVTLNPAGAGYGARNKLPNNLKELFRPIVMSVPDQIHIAQVLLFVEGYQYSKILAKKICELFQLSSHLLSKQQHYDWGLRALKTVLQTCGNILQQAKKKNSGNKLSLEDEMALLTEAIQLNTLSKLTSEDRLNFKSIIKDVFPVVNYTESMHSELKQVLIESFQELNLQANEQQINKCVELYEQLKQRMGVVIVGPPSSGKTTIRRALYHALSAMKRNVKEHIVNPKAMTRSQLLGKVDPETRQWTDGVLTTYALQAINEPLDVWTWMVCDGDIDPEWIEALNSVLDDNRLLTLPSGWRIQFQPNVNFIFETHDLIHASPATISRMGIISLSEDNVEFKNIVQTWSLKIHEDYRMIILQYIDDYFYKAVNWVLQEGTLAIKCSKIQVILTGLSQISNVQSKTQFTAGIISGLGSILTFESKENFIKMVLEITEEFVNHPTPYLHYDERKDCIENYITDTTTEINENLKLPLIFTNTIQHALDTIKQWIQLNKNEHFLLIGPHGSGKTLLLEHLIEQHHDLGMVTIFCYPNLRPEYVVHKLSQSCITVSSNRGGRIFRPKKGRLILHFKGLHRLKLDNWGSNILISFLQQLINYNGVFDKNLEWIGVENIIVVGTMQKTDILSTRFTSIVHSYIIEQPDTDNLRIIYQIYLKQILEKCSKKLSIESENKINSLATMMIQIYQEIQKHFTEFTQRHYTFSPHDITNWCYNLLRYKHLIDNSFSEGLMEAVCYEAKRIFSDRLVTDLDKGKLDEILRKFLPSVWPNDSSIIKRIDDIYFIAETDIIQSILSPWGSSLVKYYLNDWKTMVEKTILQYENENGQNIHLPIFTELLQLVAKINKITTTPGGSVILAGRAGVGRKTASRIIACMRNSRFISITDNIQQFKIDIKSAMQTCGIDRESVFLLLEDHVLEHSFVQNTINTLIATGEALDLYANTELDTIVSVLRDQLEQETSFEGSLIEYFHYRVKEQLHVIVILDVTNDNYLTIYEDYPQLAINCTTIWSHGWSETTMQEIPHLLLNNKPVENIDYSIIDIPDGFEKIHKHTPNSIQTPSRFITFIITYLRIYNNKKSNTIKKQEKLKSGVQKLIEARQIVEKLEIEAQEREAELADRQAKANEALEKITLTMKSAHSHKDELQELKDRTENENKLIMQRKKAIEIELAEVEPLLQEARGAVGNIRSESLYEIRSLRAPPDIIRDILEGVLRLMGILDTSWNSMKIFLAKRGVKEEIRSFDASFINPENRQAVEKLINTKKDSFEPKNAKRASVAAAPLATWVLANVKYSKVLEKIRPLEKEQQKLQKNLKEAEEQIAQLSSGLVDVDATVAKLKSQLSIYSREAAEVQVKLQAAKDTLENAQELVSKLDDEFSRWKEQLTDLSEELKILPTKSLLAAAFITYLSNEDEGQRRKYLENWQENFNISNFKFSIESFLSTEKEQLQWQSENLPSDKVSIQNGVIILQSWLYSLLIDPSSTTIEWLKYHFKSHPIEITSQNNPRFTSILELCLRFGKILIIEEIDSLNPILYPILRRNFIHQGARKLVPISGRLIDYHNDFQLFFASRNASLQLPPAVLSFISVVNFTTTLSGLSGQLLTSTIQQESPELENKRHELSHKQETLQIRLEELQDQLLEDLSNAQGNILENKELLTSLNETKQSSADISKSLKENVILHQQLSNECDAYKPLADFGSNLYFAILEINRLNSLYQLSVSSFKKLFLKILPSLQLEENVDKKRRLLQLVYQYVARGLFNNDRLLFALHLAHKMIPQEIPDDEWDLFTRQEASVGKLNTSNAKELVPNWIPENRIQEVFLLQIALPNLYSNLKFEDEYLWKNFMRNLDCENSIPSNVLNSITSFQQLLVIQALRPDRLYSTTTKCASKLIGFKNLNQHAIHLSQLYQEVSPTEPILLISSEGVDPSLELSELASKIMPNKFIEIAMSNTEKIAAITALTKAASEGYWLCLKNLHLVLDWLPILCQKLKELTPNSVFRLWLTTEPHPKFSPVLSQSSFHITYEAPRGIKQNLLRIYDFWTNDSKLVNRDKNRQQTENRILFALACIHVIVQERRTFIPQGWSTHYEFSNGDLFAAQRLILHSLNQSGLNIEWPVIRGLSSTAIYGGRIDNQQDELVLNSYMEQYFNENILSHLWKPLNLPGVPNGTLQEYFSTIAKLSDVDLPSYFGLPENIHRIWEINVGTSIISQLKVLALSSLATSKFNLPIWQVKLSPILSFWKKIHQKQNWLKMPIVNIKSTERASVSPLEEYILKELQFAQILIKSIHKWLIELSKVLRGTILPNNILLTIGTNLINNQVPDQWQEEWEGPTDSLEYVKAIMKRAENILEWKNQIEEINLFNRSINLSLLFHPDKFLAALKQFTAQEKKITTDNLKLSCDWTEMNSDLSITIENLQLEGAVFSSKTLNPCKSDSPNTSRAPPCNIEWIPENQDISYGQILYIPLYYSAKRQKRLANLYIPIHDSSSSTWLQAGVAFFLE